jgi:hypothetical protein
MPIGLFIPFDRAWLAVKEFIETDGALPKSIDWIADADIPDEVFPDPALVSRIARAIHAVQKGTAPARSQGPEPSRTRSTPLRCRCAACAGAIIAVSGLVGFLAGIEHWFIARA